MTSLSKIQANHAMLIPAGALRRFAALAAVAAVLGATTSGCVYRVTVQQGNFMEKRNTDQLAVGMTRVQVRYLMGTPMVPSTFNNDRWDYLYYLRVGREKPLQRQLTIFFKDDKVDRIEKYGLNPDMPETPKQRVADPFL